MHPHVRLHLRRAAVCLCLLVLFAAELHAAPTIRVQLSEKASTQPYSGRVYVFFSRRRPEPKGDHSFGNLEPFIAKNVKDLKPGDDVIFSVDDADLLAYPTPYSKMDLAGFRAQAVMRLNPFVPGIGRGAGNGFSAAGEVPADKSNAITLIVDQVNPPSKFNESEFCKLLEVRSEHLSKFLGRDVNVNAGVVLPPSYFKEPDRRYPVIFDIPGFGGTHLGAGRRGGPTAERNGLGVEFIRVYLDGSCQRGHHVFADSANNGPWATALIEDFIPELNKKFRTVPDAGARFLTGVSSGGWSSLWLQVSRPDDFGGTWSHSPDPVDFRDFQRINLYRAGENMFADPQGQRRPLGRQGDRVTLWFDDFSRTEDVLGYGGQLHSFEAVFSPRGPDGAPLSLWNRKTGAIDTAVAKEWEKYDIRLVLERNWQTLGPKLTGKLHIHMGDMDNYYLEGATMLLRDGLKKLDSDAEVVIYPGAGHGTFVPGIRGKVAQQMAETFAKNHPELIPAAVGATR